MVSGVLLAVFFGFIVIDALLGLRRGLYPALVRFGFIFFSAVCAFFCSRYLGDHILEISFGDQTVGDMFDGILHGNGALEAALEYSETVKELVWHLPEVLAKEVLFVPIFFMIRLLTLPLMIPIKRIFRNFEAEKKREEREMAAISAECYAAETNTVAETDERADASATETESVSDALPSFVQSDNKSGRKKKLFGGLAIGIAQGLFCMIVLMVPVFGISDIGETAVAAFGDSDISEMRELCETIDESFVEPVNSSFASKFMNVFGLRSLSVSTFRGLSHAKLAYGEEVKEVYYFETLEGMYPAVSAFLLLQDMDPEHMSSDDYRKLNAVFATAKESEEVERVLYEVTDLLVSDYVDDKYSNSAAVVTDVFVGYILHDKTNTANIDLEKELNSIQNVLKVMRSATTGGVESAFEEEKVDSVVDTLLETEASYETVIAIAQDPEKGNVLLEEISMGDVSKEKTKNELLKYRNEKLLEADPSQHARINALLNAIAKLLSIDLNA